MKKALQVLVHPTLFAQRKCLPCVSALNSIKNVTTAVGGWEALPGLAHNNKVRSLALRLIQFVFTELLWVDFHTLYDKPISSQQCRGAVPCTTVLLVPLLLQLRPFPFNTSITAWVLPVLPYILFNAYRMYLRCRSIQRQHCHVHHASSMYTHHTWRGGGGRRLFATHRGCVLPTVNSYSPKNYVRHDCVDSTGLGSASIYVIRIFWKYATIK